jgi:hypothetical protein
MEQTVTDPQSDFHQGHYKLLNKLSKGVDQTPPPGFR